jgi:hypothetical protein
MVLLPNIYLLLTSCHYLLTPFFELQDQSLAQGDVYIAQHRWALIPPPRPNLDYLLQIRFPG